MSLPDKREFTVSGLLKHPGPAKLATHTLRNRKGDGSKTKISRMTNRLFKTSHSPSIWSQNLFVSVAKYAKTLDTPSNINKRNPPKNGKFEWRPSRVTFQQKSPFNHVQFFSISTKEISQCLWKR